jgi:hypothetical protein
VPAKPKAQPKPVVAKSDTPVPAAKPIGAPVPKANTGSGPGKIDLGLNVDNLPAKPAEGDFSKLMSLGDNKPVEKSTPAPIIVTTDAPKKTKKKAGWKNRAKKLDDDQEDQA